ncbi:MAG: 23S rRNA (guanosine(2251)-2'-O)-methyltransferase RlmB [Bacillota bacterium]|nr:23S rRNA (guanosine(2251)-2'-O)-methyltransferase RlmB [Bacillota bacterium]
MKSNRNTDARRSRSDTGDRQDAHVHRDPSRDGRKERSQVRHDPSGGQRESARHRDSSAGQRESNPLSGDILYGKNPVQEALDSERGINKLFVSKDAKDPATRRIVDRAKERKVPIRFCDKVELERALAPLRGADRSGESLHHQGVVLYTAPFRYYEIDEILDRARDKGEAPLLVICDSITDPHNLGAIIRTANAAGAHGVVIPKRESAAVTDVVARTSSGAVEFTPVARVTNLVQTMNDLKKRGIWIAGTGFGERTIYETRLDGPLAIVIGSEGEGMGRLVGETCDMRVSIPMYGEIESLNASVAAGILLYEIIRQRNFTV